MAFVRSRAMLLVLILTWLGASPGWGAEVKHVVFLMADDLGWNDVGYHGSEIRTPHVDSLANRGVRLERYYASPVCTPTRAALMTGRNPLRFGIDRPVELRNGLPLDERLLSEALSEVGYQTNLVGKWHLGLEHVDYHPNQRGFERAYGHLGPAVDYWTHIWDGGHDWHRDGKALEEEGYTTRLIGAEAVRMIRERDESRPLFLYVAFNAPHAPLQAPDDAVARYADITDANRRTYAALVDEMDRATGSILAALEEEGLTEDTLIVWCSDNGGATRFGADNSPLRGGKGTAFEGGIRVPAVVWQPGMVEGGGVIDQMMTAADWFPTIAAAAGIETGAKKPLDGVNMWPAIKSGAEVERSQPYVVGVFTNLAVIDGPWKYVEYQVRGTGEAGKGLFRLDQDPEEQNDRSATNPEKLEAMAALLHGFPRAPTLAPDVTDPAARRRRPRAGAAKKAGGRRAAGPPGRGGGAVDGWKEITKPAWVEAAKRD